MSALSHLATLDEFLDADGTREEVTMRSIKGVTAFQLHQAMIEPKPRDEFKALPQSYKLVRRQYANQ